MRGAACPDRQVGFGGISRHDMPVSGPGSAAVRPQRRVPVARKHSSNERDITQHRNGGNIPSSISHQGEMLDARFHLPPPSPRTIRTGQAFAERLAGNRTRRSPRTRGFAVAGTSRVPRAQGGAAGGFGAGSTVRNRARGVWPAGRGPATLRRPAAVGASSRDVAESCSEHLRAAGEVRPRHRRCRLHHYVHRSHPVGDEGAVVLAQDDTYLPSASLLHTFSLGPDRKTATITLARELFVGGATKSGDLTAKLLPAPGLELGRTTSATVRMIAMDPAITIRPDPGRLRITSGETPSLPLVAPNCGRPAAAQPGIFRIGLFPPRARHLPGRRLCGSAPDRDLRARLPPLLREVRGRPEGRSCSRPSATGCSSRTKRSS